MADLIIRPETPARAPREVRPDTPARLRHDHAARGFASPSG